MRTRVKICGFTRVEDAVYAAYAGVDAIGLVFYPPSPRHVEIEQAIRIVTALPAFTTVVALFVNELEETIRSILDKVSIDCLQFHGEEAPDDCRIYGKPYIKSVAMKNDIDIQEVSRCYYDAAGLLLDAWHPDIKGGTGFQFDWRQFPRQCSLPIILAGGLNPENINDALKITSPYAVDVSSGVEAEKGIKDAHRIRDFINQVKISEQHD
jgi:phosphoribosylanthranilate isomerase